MKEKKKGKKEREGWKKEERERNKMRLSFFTACHVPGYHIPRFTCNNVLSQEPCWVSSINNLILNRKQDGEIPCYRIQSCKCWHWDSDSWIWLPKLQDWLLISTSCLCVKNSPYQKVESQLIPQRTIFLVQQTHTFIKWGLWIYGQCSQ